ncbi:hypothetical protein psyc5s11_09600 [Clostridium gelidum]|uniref:ABC-2 type transporter transmembrane domain-containing protein n=1 Tax=Clostridium gelidum TaxID=704125 RepID=A0ABM7SZ49_9CLOT|nr:ABC transporter permease [Clostridium gelidum]BCZ44893.1 hypothetical protein psyc5s11_09600 [Clostridium gelidum]
MRYLIITELFIKRLIKNPAFICMLIILPLLITMFSKVDTKEEKRIIVGIYHEEEQLSKLICENLQDKDGYIKFLIYDNKAEMIEDVETKKLECAYIFPLDFQNRLDNYKIKKCITCIESPSTILSSLSDEVVFAGIIGEYGKNIAVDFAKENNIVVGDGASNSENIARNYELFNTPEKTFSIDYKYIETDEGNSAGIKDGTNTYAIRGIVSVLILISGLFGAIKWFEDEKIGLYSSFNSEAKVIIGFISILAPTMLMAISGIITIYLSNTYTYMSIEIIAMGLYVLLVCGFSYLLKLIVKSGTDICVMLPVITIGSLIFCPVFIDASKFIPFISWINKLFPPFYYLNGISRGTSGFVVMAIVLIVCVFSGAVINFVREK